MDRSMTRLAILAAWILWQEILLPNVPSVPSWHLDSQFSGESACQEGRKIRLLEQILRAGEDGTTIINQPTIQEGTVWREAPNGERTRIRFFCFPETIDPHDAWSSIPQPLNDDLVKTQRAMGHKHINSTVAYLSFVEEEIDAAILAS
jgi:hypothetical protein